MSFLPFEICFQHFPVQSFVFSHGIQKHFRAWEQHFHLLLYPLCKRCDFLQKCLDCYNNVLNHVDSFYQAFFIRFLGGLRKRKARRWGRKEKHKCIRFVCPKIVPDDEGCKKIIVRCLVISFSTAKFEIQAFKPSGEVTWKPMVFIMNILFQDLKQQKPTLLLLALWWKVPSGHLKVLGTAKLLIREAKYSTERGVFRNSYPLKQAPPIWGPSRCFELQLPSATVHTAISLRMEINQGLAIWCPLHMAGHNSHQLQLVRDDGNCHPGYPGHNTGYLKTIHYKTNTGCSSMCFPHKTILADGWGCLTLPIIVCSLQMLPSPDVFSVRTGLGTCVWQQAAPCSLLLPWHRSQHTAHSEAYA